MCGIAGIVSTRGPASVDEIARMTGIIDYRGPDDHGFAGYDRATRQVRFAREAAGLASAPSDVLLGHRRLSILDLSEQGRCPMPSADGKLWITYNGEIYNYIELRAELAALGHRFTSGTDTEVILAAYREWGIGCLNRFNGMWSFALLDAEKATLFCARDRLGVKPFYYHWDGATFSFGSEIKQLLELPRVSREAHAGVLFDFLAFSTFGCNSEQTFFRDVLDLRGGHYLVVPLRDPGRWVPRPVRWWDIDLRRKEEGLSDEEYAGRYLELFEDAVRLRLRSDVPLGTCLSGGLDSTGIVCAVDRLLREQGIEGLQKTFTSLSDNPRYDERDYAQVVIDATRVEPSFVTPTAGRLLRDLDRLLWHQEEPFVSTSIFAGWCVYALARERGVTVTLDGQGPDEMMGGYLPTMYPALLAENMSGFRLGDAMRNLSGVRESLGWPLPKAVWEVIHEAGRGLVPQAWMPSIRRARSLLSPEFVEQGLAGSVVMQRIAEMPAWRQQTGGSLFDQKLYQATFHDSLPGILRQVDRNSMAFSIEARLPFLDYRLVEYTFALPSRQKLLDGVAKQVYRRALSGRIPDAIRDRRSKLGFVTAESDWLREGARVAVAETLGAIAPDAPWRAAPVQRVFRDYLEGRIAYDPLVWKVFALERMRANGAFTPPGAGSGGRKPTRKLRVCVISPGVAHSVPRALAIAKNVEEAHFLDFAGTMDRAALEAQGIRYHRHFRESDWLVPSITLRRMLRRIRPDVICCHYGLGDHFFNAIAYNGCPVGVIAMGTDVLHDAGDLRVPGIRRLLSRMGFRRAGAVSAKSRALAREIGRFGVTAPVDVNYWGCDLTRFHAGDPVAARERLGLPQGVKMVLSPRALEPRMNIARIVEGFESVLARWPDAILVLLGREDRACRAELEAMVGRLGIAERVRFAGMITQEALPDWYVASDVVVSVAGSEGFPNTVLEVMACRVPVVVGDIPQVRELLGEANARLCGLDAAAIGEAMVEVLADPAAARTRAATGAAIALEAGNIDANGRRWAERLRVLAAEGSTATLASIAGYRLTLRAYQLARRLRLTG